MKPATIDDYIASLPKDVAKVMRTVRKTIREEAPDADETIKYAMPAFTVDGHDLVYFGAWKHHIGFYPPMPDSAPFKKRLARYEGPKGAIRFPLDEPMPLPLIRAMVKFQRKQLRATKPKPAR